MNNICFCGLFLWIINWIDNKLYQSHKQKKRDLFQSLLLLFLHFLPQFIPPASPARPTSLRKVSSLHQKPIRRTLKLSFAVNALSTLHALHSLLVTAATVLFLTVCYFLLKHSNRNRKRLFAQIAQLLHRVVLSKLCKRLFFVNVKKVKALWQCWLILRID